MWYGSRGTISTSLGRNEKGGDIRVHFQANLDELNGQEVFFQAFTGEKYLPSDLWVRPCAKFGLLSAVRHVFIIPPPLSGWPFFLSPTSPARHPFSLNTWLTANCKCPPRTLPSSLLSRKWVDRLAATSEEKGLRSPRSPKLLARHHPVNTSC